MDAIASFFIGVFVSFTTMIGLNPPAIPVPSPMEPMTVQPAATTKPAAVAKPAKKEVSTSTPLPVAPATTSAPKPTKKVVPAQPVEGTITLQALAGALLTFELPAGSSCNDYSYAMLREGVESSIGHTSVSATGTPPHTVCRVAHFRQCNRNGGVFLIKNGTQTVDTIEVTSHCWEE